MPPGAKILIVEDEELLAANLRSYFHKRMAEVMVVSSGEAALAVASDFGPDVMIVDYALPGIDGIETVSRLKHLRLRYGCVLITGSQLGDNFQATQGNHIRCILEKPFSLAQLRGIISDQVISAADHARTKRVPDIQSYSTFRLHQRFQSVDRTIQNQVVCH